MFVLFMFRFLEIVKLIVWRFARPRVAPCAMISWFLGVEFMMRPIFIGLAVLAMSLTTVPVQSFETIERSNPMRKQLLDALRPSIEDDLGVSVQFVIDALQVDDDWAYMAGTAQHPDGSPIDFMQTPYAEAMEEGMFDGPSVKALLHWSGKRWIVETFSIGATDVVEANWPYEFDVPCELVGFC